MNLGLRSAVGERESEVEGGEKRLAERSQSATPAAEPQTEARRACGNSANATRDERAICGVERAWSRGRQGRPAPVERNKLHVGHGESGRAWQEDYLGDWNLCVNLGHFDKTLGQGGCHLAASWPNLTVTQLPN